MSATYTKSATETSTFSEIEGLTVNISTTAKVGVPFIADGKLILLQSPVLPGNMVEVTLNKTKGPMIFP